MAHLIRIGNSQGVRIPKPIIEQADLEGKNLAFSIVDEGLLIKPERKAREGWTAAFGQACDRDDDFCDQEWLDAPLVCEDDAPWE
jgi:antitoxin MazE